MITISFLGSFKKQVPSYKHLFIITPIILSLNFGGCSGSSTFGWGADSLFLINQDSDIFYDLKNPTEKYFLPYVLSEISGLSYLDVGK
ncbi:MAG: hypothetical protein O6939_12845, partial [Bacteroidetes bacterium]|nr:hypothetical protein [Bacteroidota bacterium]